MLISVYFMVVAVVMGWNATQENDATWKIVLAMGCALFSLVSAYLWQEAMKEEDQQETHRQE